MDSQVPCLHSFSVTSLCLYPLSSDRVSIDSQVTALVSILPEVLPVSDCSSLDTRCTLSASILVCNHFRVCFRLTFSASTPKYRASIHSQGRACIDSQVTMPASILRDVSVSILGNNNRSIRRKEHAFGCWRY